MMVRVRILDVGPPRFRRVSRPDMTPEEVEEGGRREGFRLVRFRVEEPGHDLDGAGDALPVEIDEKEDVTDEQIILTIENCLKSMMPDLKKHPKIGGEYDIELEGEDEEA